MNCDVYEVSRICNECLCNKTLPKIKTDFFSKWFDRYYTFNTYYVSIYTIRTANDVARYHVLKWLSEQNNNDIPLQQAVHIAWYICREVTMYLGPLMLLNHRMIPDEQFEKRLQEDYSAMIMSDDVDIDINKLISVTRSIVWSIQNDCTLHHSSFKKRIHDEECRMKL